MILDWMSSIGEWMLTNDMAIMLVGFAFLAIALVCQILINKLVDDALDDISKKLKEMEQIERDVIEECKLIEKKMENARANGGSEGMLNSQKEG